MWCLSVVCLFTGIQDIQDVNQTIGLSGFTLKGFELVNLGFVPMVFFFSRFIFNSLGFSSNTDRK